MNRTLFSLIYNFYCLSIIFIIIVIITIIIIIVVIIIIVIFIIIIIIIILRSSIVASTITLLWCLWPNSLRSEWTTNPELF